MSVGPENSVITERLLAATAMKTSRYIQNFYCYQPNRGQPDVVSPIPEKTHCSRNEQKSSIHRYLGRKLDDSLPDFDGFVVRGFWKCGKREDICMEIVDNLHIIHKKTRRSGFFANRSA
jgi:hypothetical protein